MKTRRQNVSEYRLTIIRRKAQSKTSINGGENSELIPHELITEILSRLPAKSIARCRCVSKFWASTLDLPYFTELFFTRSSARPQLLFACKTYDEVFFFSSPQPQNPDEKLSHVAATYHMKIPYDSEFERSSPIRGLVLLRDERILKGKKHKVPVICNPSTRQSLTLPKVKTRRRIGMTSYLGYDPIRKQYKVLSIMTSIIYEGRKVRGVKEEHQVLTLGTREPSWRRIKCCIPHSPQYDEICINGVLYYPTVNASTLSSVIICFDVRSETFGFIEVMESFITARLINYNGKLGLLIMPGESPCVNGNSRSIELRVLEDGEKQEWSEHVYVLPALWQNVVGNTYLSFVGVTRTNEIVLSPFYQTELPFYVFYYNIERNTIIRVGIQGMEAVLGSRVYTYLDHVENVNSLTASRLL